MIYDIKNFWNFLFFCDFPLYFLSFIGCFSVEGRPPFFLPLRSASDGWYQILVATWLVDLTWLREVPNKPEKKRTAIQNPKPLAFSSLSFRRGWTTDFPSKVLGQCNSALQTSSSLPTSKTALCLWFGQVKSNQVVTGTLMAGPWGSHIWRIRRKYFQLIVSILSNF